MKSKQLLMLEAMQRAKRERKKQRNTCPNCGESFTYEINLKNHLRKCRSYDAI